MAIFAASARLADGWARNVRVEISGGAIARITPRSTARKGDVRVGALLPALANLHSHSFQRGMAGMAEYRTAGRDSFWTWRDLMYRFLDHLTPERIEAIAALAFMEMQEAGFGSVGEFHYLHHQAGGGGYDDLSQTSRRIFAAAGTTGIGLTHLPVLYSYGGAGRAALSGGQVRFANDVTRFNRLVADCRAALANMPPDTRVAIAPHSLRATCPQDLHDLLSAHPTGPVHIHISEQQQEVAEIQAWLGARPVQWLTDNVAVDGRWCLVHATHMSRAETQALAGSGAVAGLCPITEANLGDGAFNGPSWMERGGAFGIGSDSNLRISMVEELRLLEYSQRLRDMARNVMVTGQGSVGEALYLGAAAGGARALGRDCGRIELGALADLVAVDRTDPALCALSDGQLLDGLVFAAGNRVVSDLWSAGRHRVRAGRHVARDGIVARFRQVMSDILDGL